MVQIIDEYRKPSTQERFGRAFAQAGSAAAKAVPEYIQQRNDSEYIKKNYGVDIAGLSPELRQAVMAEELKRGRLLKQAQATLGEEQPQASNQQEMMTELGVPSTKSSLSTPEGGSLHQKETGGQKQRILSPKEEIDEGVKRARESNARGVPMTRKEGIDLVREDNERNKAYNQHVEGDIQATQKKQQDYGSLGLTLLNKTYPDAPPDVQALFQRKGEEAAAANIDQADITKELAREAIKIKNDVANLARSPSPKRLGEIISGNVLGTLRQDQDVIDSMRVKLAPLLDNGLYDLARSTLSGIGYAPEEVERFITDLAEGSKRVLSQMPNIKGTPKFNDALSKTLNIPSSLSEHEYLPQQKELIRETLQSVFQDDPSTNLILLRKAFEEKGVDWRAFKSALDQEILGGNIKLTDEQYNAQSILEEPPLNNLNKLFEKIKLTGR